MDNLDQLCQNCKVNIMKDVKCDRIRIVEGKTCYTCPNCKYKNEIIIHTREDGTETFVVALRHK